VEEEYDKVVPPVSSEEKKKKRTGRKGLRAEAGWAGSGAARLVWAPGRPSWADAVLFAFFVLVLFLFSVFLFLS
jgi:hypothetical protein